MKTFYILVVQALILLSSASADGLPAFIKVGREYTFNEVLTVQVLETDPTGWILVHEIRRNKTFWINLNTIGSAEDETLKSKRFGPPIDKEAPEQPKK